MNTYYEFGDQFKPMQVIDENGDVVNEALMPDLKKEQLQQLMERMIYIRTIDERCMSLSRQGRLGFTHPSRDKKQV